MCLQLRGMTAEDDARARSKPQHTLITLVHGISSSRPVNRFDRDPSDEVANLCHVQKGRISAQGVVEITSW
jgi:hypothetical protein